MRRRTFWTSRRGRIARIARIARGSWLWAGVVAWSLSSDAGAAGAVPAYGWLEGTHWLDHAPVTAAELAGRVVLVEFWTFDCINCRRTVPAMRALAAKYPAGDVAVLGVHTPELEHERDPAAVRRAVARLGIRFPIALDNDEAVWRAFGNQAWPALYLLDGTGRARASHVGELHQGTPAWDSMLRTIEDLRREAAAARTPAGRHSP